MPYQVRTKPCLKCETRNTLHASGLCCMCRRGIGPMRLCTSCKETKTSHDSGHCFKCRYAADPKSYDLANPHKSDAKLAKTALRRAERLAFLMEKVGPILSGGGTQEAAGAAIGVTRARMQRIIVQFPELNALRESRFQQIEDRRKQAILQKDQIKAEREHKVNLRINQFREILAYAAEHELSIRQACVAMGIIAPGATSHRLYNQTVRFARIPFIIEEFGELADKHITPIWLWANK